MMNYLENKKVQISVDEVERLKKKYPNKIPILLEAKNITIDRHKYLVDNYTRFADLLLVFRRRISDLKPTESIYMFVGEDPTLVPLHKEVREVFDNLNTCGFIKISIARENTFGANIKI